MSVESKRRKWFDRFVTLLLVVVTLCCLWAVGQTAMSGNVTLFGHRIFYVTTGSMEPTIPTGSLIWVDVETADYQVGDVITFTSHDQAIFGLPNTHRIVEVLDNGQTYRTQGDANSSADVVLVSHEDVIGALDGQISIGGITTLAGYLTTKWGFLLLILCPLMVITGTCLRDFTKAYQAQVRTMAEQQLKSQTDMKKEENHHENTE